MRALFVVGCVAQARALSLATSRRPVGLAPPSAPPELLALLGGGSPQRAAVALSEEARAEVERFVDEVETAFEPFETPDFVAFALHGRWRLAYSSGWASTTDAIAYDSVEQLVDGATRSLVNIVRWARGADRGVFEAHATFRVEGLSYASDLVDHRLRPSAKLQSPAPEVIADVTANLPIDIFDPSTRTSFLTYCDPNLRVARVGTRRQIFLRITCDEGPPTE